MREIKFKALLKKNNKSFWVTYDIKGAHEELADDGSWDEIVVRDLQYTGLKDKNGVEIYEGDIVGQAPAYMFKRDGSRDERYKNKWVMIEPIEWGKWRDFSGGYDGEPGEFYGWSINPDDLPESEVINNIYSNPELLK